MLRLPNINRWGTVLRPFPVPVLWAEKGCCVLLQSNCTAAFLRLHLRRRGGGGGDGMGAEVIDPDGVAFGLDVVAVLLGVLGFQVAVFVGEDFPQIEEGTVLFQRDAASSLLISHSRSLYRPGWVARTSGRTGVMD